MLTLTLTLTLILTHTHPSSSTVNYVVGSWTGFLAVDNVSFTSNLAFGEFNIVSTCSAWERVIELKVRLLPSSRFYVVQLVLVFVCVATLALAGSRVTHVFIVLFIDLHKGGSSLFVAITSSTNFFSAGYDGILGLAFQSISSPDGRLPPFLDILHRTPFPFCTLSG